MDSALIIIFMFLSFLIGSLGALTIREVGPRIGMDDISSERSSHVGNIPRGGGIGILIIFIIGSFILDISWLFSIPAVLLSIVSLMGDRSELSVKSRLTVQFTCSIIFLVSLFQMTKVSPFIWFLILPLTLFIVGTANFYNFMDGIDGIAGITGVICFSLLAVYGATVSNSNMAPDIIILSIAIVFSCAGFLIFNIPKATVFMGDVGSILLGYLFACIVVLLSENLLEFICLTGFLFPFYADELITMLVRIKNGDSLKTAHRKHIYQLLANEYGIDHWKISTGYGAIQLAIGLSIIFLKTRGYISILILLISCFVCFSVFSVIIRRKIKV